MLCADIERPPARPRLAIERPAPPRPKQLSLWAPEPPPPCKPRAPRRQSADYLANDSFEAAILRGDRDAVCLALLKLAARVVAIRHARQPIPPTVDHEDLVQLAVIEALKRLDSWEPHRASAFSFATGSIKFTILAEVKRERRWLEVNRQVHDEEVGLDSLPGQEAGHEPA